MTHPDGSPYSLSERRVIIKQARATARELLGMLELLALSDGGSDEVEVADGERNDGTDEHDTG